MRAGVQIIVRFDLGRGAVVHTTGTLDAAAVPTLVEVVRRTEQVVGHPVELDLASAQVLDDAHPALASAFVPAGEPGVHLLPAAATLQTASGPA